MRSSRREVTEEPLDFRQLGLDFIESPLYDAPAKKGNHNMDQELFAALEGRIQKLLEKHAELKSENERLVEENRQLREERGAFSGRIDSILSKLDGI